MKLPVWRSHKEVEAFQIARIHAQELGTANNTVAAPRYIGGRLVASKTEYVLSDESGELTAIVGDGYIEKHEPFVGGYFVRYENGYESFSPAGTFEDGHSKGSRNRILHLQVGNDDWEPSIEEMTDLANMFMNTLADDRDSVIVTRAGVAHTNIEERGRTDDHTLLQCSVYGYKPEPCLKLVENEVEK